MTYDGHSVSQSRSQFPPKREQESAEEVIKSARSRQEKEMAEIEDIIRRATNAAAITD